MVLVNFRDGIKSLIIVRFTHDFIEQNIPFTQKDGKLYAGLLICPKKES